MTEDAKSSNALRRGLAILNLLAEERGGLRATDIARALGIPNNTGARLLATLVEEGYVEFDSRSRTYLADYKILDLAHRLMHHLDIRERAMPYLQDLHLQTGLLANLGVLSREMTVTIASVDTVNGVTGSSMWDGHHKPAHASGKGKLLLTYLTPEELERFLNLYELAPSTDRTITDRDVLLARLADIRAKGYCVSRGEWRANRTGLSAPVRNYLGEVVAGVGISGQDLPDDWPDADTLKHVLDAAERVSFSLGYHHAEFSRLRLNHLPGNSETKPGREGGAK